MNKNNQSLRYTSLALLIALLSSFFMRDAQLPAHAQTSYQILGTRSYYVYRVPDEMTGQSYISVSGVPTDTFNLASINPLISGTGLMAFGEFAKEDWWDQPITLGYHQALTQTLEIPGCYAGSSGQKPYNDSLQRLVIAQGVSVETWTDDEVDGSKPIGEPIIDLDPSNIGEYAELVEFIGIYFPTIDSKASEIVYSLADRYTESLESIGAYVIGGQPREQNNGYPAIRGIGLRQDSNVTRSLQVPPCDAAGNEASNDMTALVLFIPKDQICLVNQSQKFTFNENDLGDNPGEQLEFDMAQIYNEICVPPTATPTDTPTATNTPMPTATNTPEPTTTSTAVPTNTSVPAATVTPTVTITPTVVATPTVTPSPTARPCGGSDFGVCLPIIHGNPIPSATPVPTLTSTATPVGDHGGGPNWTCPAQTDRTLVPGQLAESGWYNFTLTQRHLGFSFQDGKNNTITVLVYAPNRVAITRYEGETPVLEDNWDGHLSWMTYISKDGDAQLVLVDTLNQFADPNKQPISGCVHLDP